MMKLFFSIFVVTSVVCLVGLRLKKVDRLKTLYQELMAPQNWRRVEIVDEKSMFEELIGDCIWEYLEVLIVGLTACILTFTVGWRVNSMRKGSADSGDEDVPEECLEEHCDLHRRLEEVEEVFEELEQSGHRPYSRKASNIELKLSESETMNTTDYNSSCQEIEKDATKPLNRLTIKKKNCEPVFCKSDIKAESCDKLITTETFEKSCLINLKIDKSKFYKSVRTDDLFDESPKLQKRDSHKVSDESKMTNTKVKISQRSPKKVTTMDDLRHQSRNRKSNNVRGQDNDVVVETNVNESRSNRMNALGDSRNEYGDFSSCIIPQNQGKPGKSFRCTDTESSLEERILNKSDANENLNIVGDTNLKMDSNNSQDLSTKTDKVREEVDTFSNLDVSPSLLTTAVDGVGPDRESAGSADWRDSSRSIDSRGRTPQNRNLHKEMKPKTPKLNKKDNRTMRTSKAPHQYVDEISKVVLSTHQSNAERPSTASGDTLQATGSQRRKKNQKYLAQNSQF